MDQAEQLVRHAGHRADVIAPAQPQFVVKLVPADAVRTNIIMDHAHLLIQFFAYRSDVRVKLVQDHVIAVVKVLIAVDDPFHVILAAVQNAFAQHRGHQGVQLRLLLIKLLL